MPKPCSNDIRERVVEAILNGDSHRAAARRFKVSVSSAVKWMQRFRETGSLTPAPAGGRRPVLLEPWRDFILETMAETAFLTVRELRRLLADRFGLRVSLQTVWRFLKRLRLSYKKTTQRAAEQDREDVARQRQDWKEAMTDVDYRRRVFVDETAFKTNMAPLRGWAPKGARLRHAVPHGHWKTLTLVAAMRCDGITAAQMFDKPMNTDRFVDWVRQGLVPTLRPGDIVVMDNLICHKNPKAREAIEAAGAELEFQPPYSPDFNPIEQGFASLKHHVRRAEPRDVESCRDLVIKLAKAIPAQDCFNYFKNVGYVSTSME